MRYGRQEEASVTHGRDGVLRLRTPYNPAFVAALKASIPTPERAWNSLDYVWEVHPKHVEVLRRLVSRYLGLTLYVPEDCVANTEPRERVIDLHYLGVCRDRGGGTSAAFGWDGHDWHFVFPEGGLRAWFHAVARPGEAVSLYGVLGVASTALKLDIRNAYRRLARQWHPDVCHEPDAAEVFKDIQHAYEILDDPAKRAKYDAGLALAATITDSGRVMPRTLGYRAPLRSGRLEVRAASMLGRLSVGEILSWEDLQDAQGRTLYAEWDSDLRRITEFWI